MGLRVEGYSRRFAGQPYKNDYGLPSTGSCRSSYRTQSTGRVWRESTEQERRLCSTALLSPVGKGSPVLRYRYQKNKDPLDDRNGNACSSRPEYGITALIGWPSAQSALGTS